MLETEITIHPFGRSVNRQLVRRGIFCLKKFLQTARLEEDKNIPFQHECECHVLKRDVFGDGIKRGAL